MARQTAIARTQRHRQLQQEEQQAAAEVGGRRGLITNSQARREARYSKFTVASARSSSHTNRTPCIWNDQRSVAAAAERQRAEAAVASAVRAERCASLALAPLPLICHTNLKHPCAGQRGGRAAARGAVCVCVCVRACVTE